MKTNNNFFVSFCVIFCVPFVLSQIFSINREVLKGTYNNSISLDIDNDKEYIIEYTGNKGINPVKLTVYNVNTTIYKPLLVVAGQRSQIESWQIPYVVSSVKYDNISHILCPSYNLYAKEEMSTNKTPKPLKEKSLNPVVHIKAPAAKSSFSFKIAAEIQQNFFIKSDHEIEAQVSINEPTYFYYSFLDASNSNKSSDAVLVQATSMDDSCIILSIQDSTCPVFDMEYNVKYNSYYQTMTKQAGIVVRKSIYPKGFYIVLVSKQNHTDCYKNSPTFEKHLQKSITIKVTDMLSHEEHLKLALLTIGIFVGIFGLCIVIGGTVVYKLRNNDQGVNEPAQNGRRAGSNYLWHVGIMALFYTVPAVHLVFTYQGIVHDTGNADICYYNFLCAYPLGVIYDFNHVFSNIGYVIFGVLFLFIIFLMQLEKQWTQKPGYGLQKPFEKYYAWGFALIMQGVMSACYHVCPKASNFQLDTSFMYFMTVLIVVNVYESRHETGDSHGNVVFGIMGAATILSAVSPVIGENLFFWIVFGIIQITLCVCFTWVLERRLIRKLIFEWDKLTCFQACRITFWIFGNFVNLGLVGFGIYTRSDFSTYLLMVLIVNGILYMTYYVFMKISFGEKILIRTWVFVVLSAITWVCALCFFVSNVTAWEKTATESRNLNQHCLVLKYYDNHDIWHFLSSFAIFFTFMVLVTLDDGLRNHKSDKISRFHNLKDSNESINKIPLHESRIRG